MKVDVKKSCKGAKGTKTLFSGISGYLRVMMHTLLVAGDGFKK